ncbi:hypothetical protein AX15_006030 [Amanita polypyramis BW_CC]|nr:hypothetical protein AX15_006030 [Amanita polypyramis BW_CC]
MEHDAHITNDVHTLSLNLSYILNYLPSGILARIRRGQSRHPINAFEVPSQTSVSSAIASLVEETTGSWVMGGDSPSRPDPLIDKPRQPGLPNPWAFFTSGYLIGLLVVAFVLHRMQNIILPSRTPIRHRRDFVGFLNGGASQRYSFVRHILLRRLVSFFLPLDISRTRTRLALQLPSLCVLTKMLFLWGLLVLQTCDMMPEWSWVQKMGTWSEKKEMSEICWTTFCAVGAVFCVEGFVRALDGMSTTFALNTHSNPNASPFNLIGYTFLLHVYSSPATHVRKLDGLPSRPDKHVIITIAIPLLQLTIFHYLSISKRLSTHRLIPTTLTSLLSLAHFHTTLFSRLSRARSPTPDGLTILPIPLTPTLSAPVPSAINTGVSPSSQSSHLSATELNSNYPLLNYIPNMFETMLLLTIVLTVALNTIVQLLVRGRIERPFIGLGIINNGSEHRSIGWLASLRSLPWDEDFAVLLLRMSTATLEATGLRGWGNEVAPIPTPLPIPRPSGMRRGRQISEEREYGHVKMGKQGVESLVPAHPGTSSSVFGSRYVRVWEGVDGGQQGMRRRSTKDERRKRRKALNGYHNEVRTVDVGVNSENSPVDGQNEEIQERRMSVERRWLRAFGTFTRVLWGTLRGIFRCLCIPSRNLFRRRRRQAVDVTGPVDKDTSPLITSRAYSDYAGSDDEESDSMDEGAAGYESYARFLRGEDLSEDDSDDSTFSDASDESDSDLSNQEEFSTDQEHLDGQLVHELSVWERLKEETMQLFSDLVDNHIGEDSSTLLAHMACPRLSGPLTRRGLESVMKSGLQAQNGEDEFERARREVMYKVQKDNKVDEDEERARYLCVICTIQERDIICWPCR